MKLFPLIKIPKSALCVLLAVLLTGSLIGLGASAAQAAMQSVIMPVVVLDAGHGGIDGGVTGKQTHIKESDLNLTIVKILRGKFLAAGFQVILTRKTSAGLYGLPTRGFKKRDMQRRKKVIEDCNADLVISIHQNYFSSSDSAGPIVFYNEGNLSGLSLAENIQQTLNALYSQSGQKVTEGTSLSLYQSAANLSTQNVAKAGDYFMVKCTQSASVIVECGFLSNARDETLLTDEAFRQSLAQAILLGTVTYLSKAS